MPTSVFLCLCLRLLLCSFDKFEPGFTLPLPLSTYAQDLITSCGPLLCVNGLTVFTRISAAVLIIFFAPQVRRLMEGGAYLKIGRYKEIFSFNLTVYLTICTKNLQYVTEAPFIVTIHLFRYFSVVSSLTSDLTAPFYNITF